MAAAQPQDEPEREIGQVFDEGIVAGLQLHGPRLGTPDLVGDGGKAREIEFLAPRRLHHFDAGEIFVQIIAEPGKVMAYGGIDGAGRLAEQVAGERGEREQRGQLQRQGRIQREHDAGGDGEGNDDARQRAKTGEKLGQGLHVVGDPRENLADARPVEKGGRKVFHMGEQRGAQAGERVMRGMGELRQEDEGAGRRKRDP